MVLQVFFCRLLIRKEQLSVCISVYYVHCKHLLLVCMSPTILILFFPLFLFFLLLFSCCRISSEHSPKLQIRSHSYLRAVSEVSINRSLDSLDPAGLLASPKFRSRNESYMRAMSTISQVSGYLGAHSSLLSASTLNRYVC